MSGPQDNPSWEGPQEASSPAFLSGQGLLRVHTNLLRALISQALKTPKTLHNISGQTCLFPSLTIYEEKASF